MQKKKTPQSAKTNGSQAVYKNFSAGGSKIFWGLKLVGIVTGWTACVRFPAGKNFFLLHSVQTGSGADPASYSIGTEALSPGIKWPGREADHSPPSSAKVKKAEAVPLLPHVMA
jgi:hypothetical protein